MTSARRIPVATSARRPARRSCGRYGRHVEVAVSALRAELRQWIEAARGGEDVVITERGIPVARLSGIDAADLLTRLERDGLLTSPTTQRPAAHPTTRPTQAVSGLVRRLRR